MLYFFQIPVRFCILLLSVSRPPEGGVHPHALIRHAGAPPAGPHPHHAPPAGGPRPARQVATILCRQTWTNLLIFSFFHSFIYSKNSEKSKIQEIFRYTYADGVSESTPSWLKEWKKKKKNFWGLGYRQSSETRLIISFPNHVINIKIFATAL